MKITPLGAGQEVGRSCIFVQYKGRNVMLDCGVHPGKEGSDSLPFFDWIPDIGSLDLILITHFHMDHCAALPYFTEKYFNTAGGDFKGRIFMTHATKAVMKLLLHDNIRLNARNSRPLYDEEDLSRCMDKIETIDFHETCEVQGVKFTATAAGHVLGACMFHIEIDGKTIFYTGDYSTKSDRHLCEAEVPRGMDTPDVMIVESTFGTTTLPGREERERELVSTVDAVVRRGGSCLIPIFALGRAQELLLILDEYWQANPDLHSIPVFYASKLASKALRVYQTFVNMMNAHIRSMIDIANPFNLTHVKNMSRTDFDAVGSCVVLAAPGFLQNGVSRKLFERWCDDERNGVIIAGYTIEGTLAEELKSMPTEITCTDNVIKKRRCQIEYISFSAHVDFAENMTFIKAVQPRLIILVHGEKKGMKSLKDELERASNWPTKKKPTVTMPENGLCVSRGYSRSVMAECVGSVGSAVLEQLEAVDAAVREASTKEGAAPPSNSLSIPESSVLVNENFVSKIVAVSELSQHSSCRVGRVKQRVLVPVPEGLLGGSGSGSEVGAIVRAMIPYLEEVFDFIATEDAAGGDVSVLVQGSVSLAEDYSNSSSNVTSISVSWEASPSADMTADCAIGVLLQALSAPSLLRRSMADDDTGIRLGSSQSATKRKGCSHTHYHSSTQRSTGSDMSENPVMKRIKKGDLDPSKAIPDDALQLLVAMDGASQEATLKLHKKRLLGLQKELQNCKTVKSSGISVAISADGLKLLFSSKASKGAPSEAYCFIVFSPDGNTGKHDAVLKSEDEALKTSVLRALREVA
jgi:cleavage and polyadenylation specificity factor subunit 3